jgi:arylsulfatase A-like enzyme
MSWTKLARRGAAEGLLAWVAYWSVESFLLHLLPWFGEPAYLYTPPHAGFTALLLGLYAAAGLVTGTLAGIWAAALASKGGGDLESTAFRLRPAVTLLLFTVALSSALPRLPRTLPAWVFVLFSLPVGLSLAASLLSSMWARRLRLLASPWTASIILLSLPVLFARASTKPTLVESVFSLLPYIAAALLLSALTALKPWSWRTALPTVSVAALLLAACFLLRQEPRQTSQHASATPPPDKPNVILITLDTVRADHLSLYGYERDTTPNLRRLALQSTVYTHAISPGDMTLSSHASIFTGLYPSWHKAHFDEGYYLGRPLDARYPTLAEVLSSKGFDAAGVVANYLYLAPGFGLDRGFTYHDSSGPVVFLGSAHVFLLRERVRNFLTRFYKTWEFDETFRRAEDINQTALTVLDREKAAGRKFFCFLNYMDAHWPYLPPDRFATLYPGYDPHFQSGHYDQMEREVLTLRRPVSEHERQHLLSQYDGGIAYMDAALGKLVDQLKQRGLYDNTLLIIAADHGEAFGNRAMVGHALSVYQEMVHVPLLIKYPRESAPAVVDDSVSLADLMPTVLGVLGYAAPKNVQGRNLLLPAPAEAENVISETFVHPLISTWSPRFLRSEHAIFSGPLKFIQSSKGDRELYDLSQDPHEEHNLFTSRPADRLELKLVQYLKAAAVDRRKQAQAQVSSESIEKLKSLGYVQGK